MIGHQESSHTFIKPLLGVCMVSKAQGWLTSGWTPEISLIYSLTARRGGGIWFIFVTPTLKAEEARTQKLEA